MRALQAGGFRGGKGVATFLGLVLALSWPVGLLSCATWLAAAALSRISSVGALVAALDEGLIEQAALAEELTGEVLHRLADVEAELRVATEERQALEAQEQELCAKRDELFDSGPPGPAEVAKRYHDGRIAHAEGVMRRKRCAEEREATLRRVVDAAKADVRSRARPEPCVGWLATLAMLFLAFGAGMMVQTPYPTYAVTH